MLEFSKYGPQIIEILIATSERTSIICMIQIVNLNSSHLYYGLAKYRSKIINNIILKHAMSVFF